MQSPDPKERMETDKPWIGPRYASFELGCRRMSASLELYPKLGELQPTCLFG